MFKLLRRVLAYVIDMMVIILITQSLTNVPMINKQLDAYNKYYDEYMDLFEDYGEFKLDLVNKFDDKKLDKEEYEDLIEEHEEYQDVLIKYYDDEVLSEKEYNKINEKIDADYQEKYEKAYYKIEQNSIAYFVIYIVIGLVYFIGFNKITGGQTLGKKITRLKVVSSKDNGEVSVWSYFVRAIILYQLVYYLVRLIGVNILGMNDYYTVNSVVSSVQSYLKMLIILTIMIRIDGRGIHDLLAKTKVILIDKNGNEVKDKFQTMYEEKKEEIKKSKKIIDEEPSE